MKKLKMIAVAVAAVLLLAAPASAGYYSGNDSIAQVVKSVGGPTNQVVASTNLNWPSYIAASTYVTNVTPFTVSGPHSAIELDVALLTTNGIAATNVIMQVGRSVRSMANQPAGSVTNAAGDGLIIEWFATVTNTIPAAAPAGKVYGACVTFGPNTGQSVAAGDGGISTLYIGYIQAPGIAVTNYSVWVNSTP